MNVVLNLRIRSTFQVADELVAEFSDPINGVTSPDQVGTRLIDLFSICVIAAIILEKVEWNVLM